MFKPQKFYVISNGGRYVRGFIGRPWNLVFVYDKRDAMWLCKEEKDIFLEFLNKFFEACERYINEALKLVQAPEYVTLKNGLIGKWVDDLKKKALVQLCRNIRVAHMETTSCRA